MVPSESSCHGKRKSFEPEHVCKFLQKAMGSSAMRDAETFAHCMFVVADI